MFVEIIWFGGVDENCALGKKVPKKIAIARKDLPLVSQGLSCISFDLFYLSFSEFKSRLTFVSFPLKCLFDEI